MSEIFIRHKHQKIFFELPPSWKLLSFADFKGTRPKENVKEMTRNALQNPINSAPLKERISPSDSIAVIIEDITRVSPKKLILEALLEELDEVPIPINNITVIIASGTHRALSEKELEGTFGKKVNERYKVINHDCRASDLVPIGRLKTGQVVKVNRKVHEASFRVGIGSIFPHALNGFGGGGKIFFPGVADFESIREHHLKCWSHPKLELGNIDGNLFHEEVSSIARSGNLDFIINSVLDHQDNLYDIVAGHIIEAHRTGIEQCRRVISKEFEKKADLTLITSFPYIEGAQFLKPLSPASMVTKKGGCIILYDGSRGNIPDHFVSGFDKFSKNHSSNLLQGIQKHFQKGQMIFDDCSIELNMAAAAGLKAQHWFNVVLVSENIDKNTTEKMGFIFAEDLNRAFELSSHIIPPNPEVHVIPSGSIILPIVKNPRLAYGPEEGLVS